MERIIEIKGLSLMAFIGVPDQEREKPQQLCFDLRFAAAAQPEALHDDIAATIDYAAVSQRLAALVDMRPRKLIETLADEITADLLASFSLRWVELTVRKFILPNTEHVAVTLRREA